MKNFLGKDNHVGPTAEEVPASSANAYSQDDAGSELGVAVEVHLKRNLKSRHLQMIAIGRRCMQSSSQWS